MTHGLSAQQVIDQLGLEPLEPEGGYYRRVYTGPPLSSEFGQSKLLSDRPLYSSIYYLMTPDSHSQMHRLQHDEIYHFYLGDPVELLEISETDCCRTLLGSDILRGNILQHCVSALRWQGSRLVPGGQWALLGTTMSPAFDMSEFELANADDFSNFTVPQELRELLKTLTASS